MQLKLVLSLCAVAATSVVSVSAQTPPNYHACILERTSNSQIQDPQFIATIKNACANLFARDVTQYMLAKLKAVEVGNDMWTFQNTGSFHVISVCLEITHNFSNSAKTYCGSITQQYILYGFSDGTIPPMAVGKIEISYDGKTEKNFWGNHSYKLVSVRGFE